LGRVLIGFQRETGGMLEPGPLRRVEGRTAYKLWAEQGEGTREV